MSKQIYIDSNGNEVLVSGTIINDNNLPHYTGTPSAGSTAEAIGAKVGFDASITSANVQVASGNRILLTCMTSSSDGIRFDIRGDSQKLYLATTTNGGSTWTTINSLNFPSA